MATVMEHICLHSESLRHFRQHTILPSDDSERNSVSSEATFHSFEG